MEGKTKTLLADDRYNDLQDDKLDDYYFYSQQNNLQQ